MIDFNQFYKRKRFNDFYDFMLGFVNDDTPLGSLANHILEDTHFPREEKNNKEIART